MNIVKNRKGIVATALAVVLLLSMILVVPIKADAATSITGVLTSSESSTKPFTIKCDGKKTVKLRICTFSQGGSRTAGKVNVIVDTHYNGSRYLWHKEYKNVTGCTSNGTTNLTLPKGYTSYKITVYRADNSNKNLQKTYYASCDAMYAK